jgi:Tfp pilus assembly protein PilN
MIIPRELKKWLAIGSGAGIEISGPHGSESLRVSVVRVRPNGARVLGGFTVEDFPHQAAGAWGNDYNAFLRKLGLKDLVATVLLPRHDVIVRHLTLPGVSDRDLAAAIQFQMEGLHPYPEDDVAASWARLPGTASVMVAMARRHTIERYATLFAEAGIRIGSFTASAGAIYSALRLFGATPAAELLACEARAGATGNGQVEFYGEGPAHPVFSAGFDVSEDRAAALAASELRLEPGFAPRPLGELVGASPALPHAAALASACPRLSLQLNLLPVEHRQGGSRALWVPATLGAVVLLLAGVLAAFPQYESRRYLRLLQTQIAALEPQAKRAADLDRAIETVRERTALLDSVRGRAKADMDALAELTRILPPPTWLNSLDVTPAQIAVAGETDQAAPLLKVIDASPLFEGSEFNLPPIRTAAGEAFRIRARREGVKP